MRVSDFHYELPEHLIAQYPPERRTDARLLWLDGDSGRCREQAFSDLPVLLHRGDLMVFNDTRVLKARLAGRRATGGQAEVLVERVLEPRRFLARVKPARRLRAGSRIHLDVAEAVVIGRRDEVFEMRLEGPWDAHTLMARSGAVPLPPYVRRIPEPADAQRYQTVYAARDGAVAAPTAGLHFDHATLRRIDSLGVGRAAVTLHVGSGTFQPLRTPRVQDHRMHAEHLEVGRELCEQVAATRAAGGRVIAVGTTSVRALETAAARSGTVRPYTGDTSLFIYPGYEFRCVDAMITNFHLPGSTLLMLVCAFAGRDQVLGAYRYAVERRFRFFSYGDAMFLTRRRI